MAINDKHPSYAAHIDTWLLMRHAYGGEAVIKSYGVRYLPATPGQVLDGALEGNSKKPGYISYQAYKARAVFPDFVADAVERYVGMIHTKDAVFELPERLQPMLEKATIDGESLQALMRRINEQQLITGRVGLLLDLPPNPTAENPLPYIALYCGESIINWDNSADHNGVNALTMVVLDESGPTRKDTFTWVDVERYRVLQLLPKGTMVDQKTGALDASTVVSDDVTEGVGGEPVYAQGVFDRTNGQDFSQEAMRAPLYRGATLAQIPFVFVNSKDIVPSPDKPPLLGLARISLTIYRGEADYRQTLFMQGQDTLVTIGTLRESGSNAAAPDEPLRVGAGCHIGLDLEGDAKYVGIGADGIEGQHTALADDYKRAESKAGALISPSAGKQESGDALTTRLAAQTVSIGQIANTSAAALENILKIAAVWVGADPDKVRVRANEEFAILPMNGQELSQLIASRTMGAPLSLESIHAVCKDRGLAKFDFQTEMDKIAEEDTARARLMSSIAPDDAPGGGGQTGGGRQQQRNDD